MTAPPRLPFDRPDVLGIAPLYDVLRRQGPVVPVRTPAGDPAWLVTGHAQAREVFADDRFRRAHPDPERAPRISDSAIFGRPNGDPEAERQGHQRLPSLLVPAFSASRMRRLDERVRELAEQCMDDLAAAYTGGDAVDLSAYLSRPLPVLVICELLGVPYEDRAYFGGLSDRLAALSSGDDAMAAMGEFTDYMHTLVEAKRRDLRPDVVSDLVRAQSEDPTFTDEMVARLAAVVLFAGHETTVNNINLGVLWLLADPTRRDALAADPGERVHATVEEILRVAALNGVGLPRYAQEDAEIGGVHITKGEAVLVSTTAANRDAAVFDHPDEFDTDRPNNPHLSFGHGGYFCVGASLARAEMRAVFSRLFTRFPSMRLGVDLAEIEIRLDRQIGGVTRVPVRW